MFKKYPKIYRLGSSETEGILEGKCYIQEKLDGANTSIWLEDGEIHVGSRNNDITRTNSLNNFYDYVLNHEGIKNLLDKHPKVHLYGEWLIKHTINYSELHTKQFYLFDIFNEDGSRLSIDDVYTMAEVYKIKTPHLFAVLEKPTFEQLNKYVGISKCGENGEGIIIKNLDFINQFDNITYAKIVTDEFKESNAIVFGSNNRHSDSYWEMYIVNRFMTLPRIEKVKNKLLPLMTKDEECKYVMNGRPLSVDLLESLLMLTPRVSNTAYHDLLTEEIWAIANKVGKVDFKTLSRVATRKATQIYKDLLNNQISINDQTKV